MNFFKSSFFNEFKLQDVLAAPQEDLVSTSADSEKGISTAKEQMSSETENLSNPRSEASSSGALGMLSSDSTSSACAESHANTQEEQIAGIWSLGGLVKSIALKSEGIIQTYRKDLEEFGSGLKKETQLLAEVASHAVKDLPTSLETGAYMAQDSIESVGQAVEEFSGSVWRGTADLIAQGKEAVLHFDDEEVSAPTGATSSSSSVSRYDNSPVPISGGKYSRFEAQVRAMQHDSSTYCDEPGDGGDCNYNTWKSTFSLGDKKEDIENLLGENTFIQELLGRFVPDVVSEETFWTRYFYRLHKLQQTEEARVDLVKRASALEEEDLGWDTEEEFDENVHDEKYLGNKIDDSRKAPNNLEPVEKLHTTDPTLFAGKASVVESSPQGQINVTFANENVLRQPGEDEEDLGWEVPEDVDEFSSNDGKRSSNSEASWEVPDVSKEEIRKSSSHI